MGLFDLLIWSAISRDMSRAGWDAERMAREIMTSPAPQYTYPTTYCNITIQLEPSYTNHLRHTRLHNRRFA